MGRKPAPDVDLILRSGKLLHAFPVMHRGWELDDKGAVYEMPDGKRYLILTNHGAYYVARPKELLDKILEYQSATEATELALELFHGHDRSPRKH
jgi:hypothetical protein